MATNQTMKKQQHDSDLRSEEDFSMSEEDLDERNVVH